MKTIAFFNNKGGVGKTSLVYHLAFMLAEHGLSVIKPADGAIGAHVSAVRDCYHDFLALARRITAGAGISLP